MSTGVFTRQQQTQGREGRARGSGRRRSVRERLTTANVVAVGAAVVTFVLVAVALQDRRETMTVAVVAADVAAGTLLEPGMVRAVEVPASVGFTETLVPMATVEAGGLVVTRTVLAGEPLVDTALGSEGAGAGSRVMSIPLSSAQAADGQIEVGDRIDLIRTDGDTAAYVLVGSEVISRSSVGGGGLGSAGRSDLVLTVVVDEQQALVVAAAIEAGDMVVVRSSGAPPATVAPPAETPADPTVADPAVPSQPVGG